MKRDFNIFNYGHAIHQEEIIAGLIYPDIPDAKIQDDHSPADAFLKIVYGCDSRTKLPTGDLCYMVSDKVNPEIKSWVLDNLMLDVSSAANSPAPAGLSDDDIAELSRLPHEDSESYMNRLNDYFNYHKELYERLSNPVSEGDGARNVPSESK